MMVELLFRLISLNICVLITGVCVAGAASSEDGNVQLGRAEGAHQQHGEGSSGQCTLEFGTVQLPEFSNHK